MKCCLAAIAALLTVIASGCVTSAAIKDASTKHTNNLAGLHQAVGNYRRQLHAYYDRLVQQQREAHIALHVNETIKSTAKTQSESISRKILKYPDSQESSEDFIRAGAGLADAFMFWGNHFDRWVNKVKGKTLKDRRKTLRDLADKREKEAKDLEKKADELDRDSNSKPDEAQMTRRKAAGTQKTAKTIRETARMSDDKLTYVQVAIELKRQRSILDAQFDLLAAQVATMQAFHAKIDEFLSIDATIDGAKIAAAAASGSKADISGIILKQ